MRRRDDDRDGSNDRDGFRGGDGFRGRGGRGGGKPYRGRGSGRIGEGNDNYRSYTYESEKMYRISSYDESNSRYEERRESSSSSYQNNNDSNSKLKTPPPPPPRRKLNETATSSLRGNTNSSPSTEDSPARKKVKLNEEGSALYIIAEGYSKYDEEGNVLVPPPPPPRKKTNLSSTPELSTQNVMILDNKNEKQISTLEPVKKDAEPSWGWGASNKLSDGLSMSWGSGLAGTASSLPKIEKGVVATTTSWGRGLSLTEPVTATWGDSLKKVIPPETSWGKGLSISNTPLISEDIKTPITPKVETNTKAEEDLPTKSVILAQMEKLDSDVVALELGLKQNAENIKAAEIALNAKIIRVDMEKKALPTATQAAIIVAAMEASRKQILTPLPGTQELVANIISSNASKAAESRKEININPYSLGSIVKPLYIKPSEIPSWNKITEFHKKNKSKISNIIARQNKLRMKKEKQLAITYRKHADKWKSKIADWEAATGRGNLLASLSSGGGGRRRSGYCTSDYEEQQLLQQLIEEEEKLQMYAKTVALCPPMHLSAKSRYYDSFSSNTNSRLTTDGSIMKCTNRPAPSLCPPNCNCPRALAKLCTLVNPWTDIEKCIFLDKFVQFPKDFRKIASYLANKSTEETVCYYYDTKKSINYKLLLHEHLTRRRGSKKSWTLTAASAKNAGINLPKEIWQSESSVETVRGLLDDNSYSDMRVPVANKNKLRGSRNAAIYGDRSDSDNEKNRSDEYDSDDALVKPLSISAKNHNKSKGSGPSPSPKTPNTPKTPSSFSMDKSVSSKGSNSKDKSKGGEKRGKGKDKKEKKSSQKNDDEEWGYKKKRSEQDELEESEEEGKNANPPLFNLPSRPQQTLNLFPLQFNQQMQHTLSIYFAMHNNGIFPTSEQLTAMFLQQQLYGGGNMIATPSLTQNSIKLPSLEALKNSSPLQPKKIIEESFPRISTPIFTALNGNNNNNINNNSNNNNNINNNSNNNNNNNNNLNVHKNMNINNNNTDSNNNNNNNNDNILKYEIKKEEETKKEAESKTEEESKKEEDKVEEEVRVEGKDESGTILVNDSNSNNNLIEILEIEKEERNKEVEEKEGDVKEGEENENVIKLDKKESLERDAFSDEENGKDL